MPCPANSWSSVHAATSCQCLSGHYRENESDLSSPCVAVQRIDSSRIEVTFINEEKVNISIVDSIESNVRVELKCFSCAPTVLGQSASVRVYGRDEAEACDQSCFISSSSNNWLVLFGKRSNNVRSRIKLFVRQEINGRELAKSFVYLSLNERLAEQRLTCEAKEVEVDAIISPSKSLLFKSLGVIPKVIHHRKSTTCLNVSLDLAYQINSLFGQHDLMSKIRAGRLHKFNVYGLLVSSDYHLIPAGVNGFGLEVESSLPMATTATSSKSYQLLDLGHQFLATETIKELVLNGSVYSFLLCSHLEEIERVRIELKFRPSDDQDKSDDRLDVFSIDIKLFELCFKNGLNSKLIRQFGDGFLDVANHSIMSLKNPLSERSLNGAADAAAGSNLKVHVLLPITLSFLFVTAVILLTLFVRRYVSLNRIKYA